MKKQIFQIRLLIAMGLIQLSTFVYSQDPNFYIFLCFGQSNMQGQGIVETQDRAVDSRFQVMEAVSCSNLGRTKGSWYKAIPPLCRCYSGLSPVDFFGRTLTANLPDSIRVGVINVSVAGCKIELFDKHNYPEYVATAPSWMLNIINEYGGNPYKHLVEIAKLAQQDGVIKGILMHQGESNTGDNQWPVKVKGVYDTLLYDLGLNPGSVPLLAGEVVHADQGGVCAGMNSIIAKLPQTIPNSYVISSSGCKDGADNLHFNAEGYRELGWRYAVKMLSLLDYDTANLKDPRQPLEPPDPVETEAYWFEAERYVKQSVESNFKIVSDTNASNEKYITVQPGVESLLSAPILSEDLITIPFKVTKDTIYNIYGRMKCPTSDDDSFWVKIDNGSFIMCHGLVTGEGFAWLKLLKSTLTKGEHDLTIGYREDGACLDKIYISYSSTAPSGMGEADSSVLGLEAVGVRQGFALGQNYPNPFKHKTSISFEVPEYTYVSLKIYNLFGAELVELAGKKYSQGKHVIEFDSAGLSTGIYSYVIKADRFSACQKMFIQNDR